MTGTHKIKTFLWFDNQAEAAVNHYMAAFKDSKIITSRATGRRGRAPRDR